MNRRGFLGVTAAAIFPKKQGICRAVAIKHQQVGVSSILADQRRISALLQALPEFARYRSLATEHHGR